LRLPAKGPGTAFPDKIPAERGHETTEAMYAAELINPRLAPLGAAETAGDALRRLHELRVARLPVADASNAFVGSAPEALLAASDPQVALGSLPLEGLNLAVHADARLFEFIHYFAAYHVEVLPVVGEGGRLLGALSDRDAATFFAQAFSSENGGVLVLEMNYRDYSLAEISRLVESNQVRVVASFVEVLRTDSNRLALTLKLNTHELQYVLATLERFGYQVVAHLQWQSDAATLESERIDSLMRYLEI
jgi:CBS domain-containing protein